MIECYQAQSREDVVYLLVFRPYSTTIITTSQHQVTYQGSSPMSPKISLFASLTDEPACKHVLRCLQHLYQVQPVFLSVDFPGCCGPRSVDPSFEIFAIDDRHRSQRFDGAGYRQKGEGGKGRAKGCSALMLAAEIPRKEGGRGSPSTPGVLSTKVIDLFS